MKDERKGGQRGRVIKRGASDDKDKIVS